MSGRTVVFSSGRKAPPCDYGPRWLYDEALRCADEHGISGGYEHRCVRDARPGSRFCAVCAKRGGL